MSNIIQGIKVGSTTYKYDYNSLENLPAPELPSSTQNDSGKTLIVNSSGNPAWDSPLPTHDTSYAGSDAGKALIVATNGELKWDEAGGGDSLPDTSAASGGDVLILMVGDCGGINLGWGSPFPTYDTGEDIGKVLMITANGPEWVMPS